MATRNRTARGAARLLAWLFGRGGMKRTVLVPLLALIVLGYGAGWAFYLRGSRDAVFVALDRLALGAAYRARERVQDQLGDAVELARSNGAFFASLRGAGPDLAAVRRSFRLQLLERPRLEIISIGLADGEYAEAQRLPDGSVRTGSAGRDTGGDLVLERADGEGDPVEEVFRREGYDPRTRPWYLAAASASGPAWSEPYAAVSTEEPIMAAVVPLRDGGALRGVVTVDLRLGSVGESLAAIAGADGGVSVIVDAFGRVVATSEGIPIVGSAGKLAPVTASAGLGPAIWKALPGAPGVEPDARLERVVVAGAAWRAVLLDADVPGASGWRILLAYPEGRFLATLRAVDRRMGLLFVLMLGSAIALAFVVAHRVTLPLSRLGGALAGFEPESYGRGGPRASAEIARLAARPDEIGRLAASFSGLDRRLEASFAQLRASLVEKESLLKEVHHRVKNNLQVISSLLSLQAGASGDPRESAALERSMARVQAMALVHDELYASDTYASVGMDRYLERVSASLAGRTREGCSLVTRIEEGGVRLPLDKALACGLIASELVANALEHAFPTKACGEVRIGLAPVEGGLELAVLDDGEGIDGRTEGRRGIGRALVEGLAAQLSGRFEFVTGPGGTRASVRFPSD